uniref:C2H2-type domain-containing protein n=1 Tax=Anopheles maculatus TaxID=74869 RepID=A0A182SUI6_9DIPT
MDDSMLPEGAITALDHSESSVRDWINYDELPLLLNQQKQQQQRPALSTDHVTLPPSDALVENERSKVGVSVSAKPIESQSTNNAGVSGCCEMFPPFIATVPVPSLEGFSQHNGTVLMNSSNGSTAHATVVPDFSHYCVECEKFFPSNEMLQAHMELNHRLFGEDQSLIAMAASTARRASFVQAAEGYGGGLVWPCAAIVDSTNQCPKRAFFCDLCNISFDLVESYYMHNQSVHGGGGIGTEYR